MYDMELWCKEHGIPVTYEQAVSDVYLKMHGKRFMIDYGYENAVAVAERTFDEELERKAVR